MAGDIRDLHNVVKWYNTVVLELLPPGDNDGDGSLYNDGDAMDHDEFNDGSSWAYPTRIRKASAVGLRTLSLAVEHIERLHRARFGLTGRQDSVRPSRSQTAAIR